MESAPTTSLRTYAVNTYAADVPGVDVGPHIDLCAKSQPSAKPTEGADFPRLDPNPVGVAGGMARIKVAYNLDGDSTPTLPLLE